MRIDELKALQSETQETWRILFGEDFASVGDAEVAKINRSVFVMKTLAPEIMALVEGMEYLAQNCRSGGRSLAGLAQEYLDDFNAKLAAL